MVNKKRIALDVDGVLLHFLQGFERIAAIALGRSVTRINRAWDLAVAYGFTKAEHDTVWAACDAMGLYLDLPVLPGAFEAVQLLTQAGYEVHAVSAILPKYLKQRRANLRAHGFDVAHVHATGDGSKAPILRELAPIMFVDDQLKHLHAASFIPNRVWLRSADEQFPEEGQVHTHEANTLLEFVQHWLQGAQDRLAA